MKNEEMMELVEKAGLPWAYRPREHDDWGMIRASVLDVNGFYPVMASACEGLTRSNHEEHRRNKTDPFANTGNLIVAAVNALPAHVARIKELEEALRRIEQGEEPRPIGKMWRADAKASKNDKCIHDAWMYETCGNCVSDFARTTLGGSQ